LWQLTQLRIATVKTYAKIFGVVLLLACAAPTPVMAEGPVVTQTMLVDTQGDVAGFLDLHRQVQKISQRLEFVSKARVMYASVAGDQSQMVAVVVEYPDLATWAKERAALFADAEWQAMFREDEGKVRLVSSSLWTDITPE
jgi:hypothetical protein